MTMSATKKRAKVLAMPARQRAVWRFICEFYDAHGHGPNQKEIRYGLGITSTQPRRVVKAMGHLHSRGLIAWHEPREGGNGYWWDVRRAFPRMRPDDFSPPDGWADEFDRLRALDDEGDA